MTSLISVHVPKAGGTSTLNTLQRAFGAAFRSEYSFDPANPSSQRVIDPASYFARRTSVPPATCIHGHFHPGMFDLTADTVLATILRHPVDNLISIYWFWQGLGNGHTGLRNYVVDNELSIVETARLPLLRRLLSETYFGGFDMARFDVIGTHDDRATFFTTLAARIGRRLDPGMHENETPPASGRAAMAADPALRRRLEDLLADDVRFFERHAR